MDDHSSLMVDPTNPICDEEAWQQPHGQTIVPAQALVEAMISLPATHAKIVMYLALISYGATGYDYRTDTFLSDRLSIPLATLQKTLRALTGPKNFLESITVQGRTGYRVYRNFLPEQIENWRRIHEYEQQVTRRVAKQAADPYKLPNRTKGGTRRLALRFSLTCVYCKRVGTEDADPDGETWQRDHVWPKSQGGQLGGNIVLACRRCNVRKHTMAATEFLAKLAAEGVIQAAD